MPPSPSHQPVAQGVRQSGDVVSAPHVHQVARHQLPSHAAVQFAVPATVPPANPEVNLMEDRPKSQLRPTLGALQYPRFSGTPAYPPAVAAEASDLHLYAILHFGPPAGHAQLLDRRVDRHSFSPRTDLIHIERAFEDSVDARSHQIQIPHRPHPQSLPKRQPELLTQPA